MRTPSFAAEGLSTFATLVTRIREVITRATIADLLANGDVQVTNPDVASEARETAQSLWQEASQ